MNPNGLGQSQALPGAPATTGHQRPGPIDSRALMQGARVIEIAHEGTVYRLQATRLGKLILTK